MKETDADQMLTAEVGLKATRGGMSALAVGEGQRAEVEDEAPHIRTQAGLGQEDNSPFQDAARAGSPSLLGKGG